MINGCKAADREQANCHFPWGRCKTTGNRSDADPDEKDLHHPVPTPFVSNPSGGNSTELGAIPAGWIADKWRRDGMMQIFFIGIGIASIACSFATTPREMAVGLFAVGCFAAIYHPVGIAMVVQGRAKTGMPLAINGVFGNLGVAAAPLLTGALLDFYDWKWAFIIPGIFSIAIGIAYSFFLKAGDQEALYPSEGSAVKGSAVSIDRNVIVRVFGVIFLTTAFGGIIFQSTTYALPKIFEIRLIEMATSLTLIGVWSAFVFAMAAFAQLVVGHLVDKYSIRTIFAIVTATHALPSLSQRLSV